MNYSPIMNFSKIMELLNGEVIFQKIDKPLDEILNNLIDTKYENTNLKKLQRIITSLLKKLYSHGFITDLSLLNKQELPEIIWFLENNYNNHDSKGYEGALYDSDTQSKSGVEDILKNIIENLKSIEREKYISAIITKYYNFLKWEDKKVIIKKIFDEFGYLLPSELKGIQISALVPRIEELLLLIITSERAMIEALNYY